MRLNPFAFPSDTTFRFLLFIAAIVGASLQAFEWVYSVFFTDAAAFGQALLACGPSPDHFPSEVELAVANACRAAVNAPVIRAVVVAVAALLAGGAIAYGIAVVRARRRYRPFSRDDSPELADSFASLAAELEVEPAPSLRWQPIDQRAVGLAFGPPGNRELAFTGGLVPLSVRDRPAFRAIVLHELAHLRNGDVDLSYYAIGLWRALLVLAMLPFVLSLLRELPRDPATVASFGWRFFLLVPLVYIIRSAILRAREHDADVRASTREPEIRRVLATAAAKEPSHSKLRRLVAWHPSTAHRVDVIDDPSPLLRLGLLDAFGIGIVGSLAYEDVALVLGMAGMDAIAARGLAAFAFGPLVGVILALGRGARRSPTSRPVAARFASSRSAWRSSPGYWSASGWASRLPSGTTRCSCDPTWPRSTSGSGSSWGSARSCSSRGWSPPHACGCRSRRACVRRGARPCRSRSAPLRCWGSPSRSSRSWSGPARSSSSRWGSRTTSIERCKA